MRAHTVELGLVCDAAFEKGHNALLGVVCWAPRHPPCHEPGVTTPLVKLDADAKIFLRHFSDIMKYVSR